MKKITTVIILMVFVWLGCKHNVVHNNAEIAFKQSEYNFGELKLNSNALCQFFFSNPHDVPLVIQQVKTSCGCAIPQWTISQLNRGNVEK